MSSLLLLERGNYCLYLVERLISLLLLVESDSYLLCESPSLLVYAISFLFWVISLLLLGKDSSLLPYGPFTSMGLLLYASYPLLKEALMPLVGTGASLLCYRLSVTSCDLASSISNTF
jgi:hypothetical protein